VLGPSFTGASVQSWQAMRPASPFPLTFRHRTGVGPYTSACAFAETCVFGKQSLRPFLCGPQRLVTPPLLETGDGAPPPEAPLLPKLRGDFAEFLGGGYLARLRMLSQPTCVGLRYGHRSGVFLEAFLGRMGSATSPACARSASPLGVSERTDLPIRSPYRVARALPVTRIAYPSASPLRSQAPKGPAPVGGAGILTCCPSPTPFGLSLGPPNPKWTNLAWETLGFRRQGFSPCFSLLMPGFSLPRRRAVLTVCLQPTAERSPTNRARYWRPAFRAWAHLPPYPASRDDESGTTDPAGRLLRSPAASVLGLSPVGFSAPNHSTGEHLRTL
jgi:hypothetical protein